VLTEVTQSVAGRKTLNPKTVLGFYATILGLLFTFTVASASVLAFSGRSLYLLPWLFGFAAAGGVALVAIVVRINLSDPEKLMLGQVSGTEYVQISHQKLGDTVSGERTLLTPSVAGAAELEGLVIDDAREILELEGPEATDVRSLRESDDEDP
jgi:hypothetical protein